MKTYKQALHEQMLKLAEDESRVFIGYNLANGSKCYGTMDGVPREQIIEMPVAEALMAGMATGLALDGFKPVLIFERHDFMLLAADQIINHLDKIKALSHGDFNPSVTIRAIVGSQFPFDPGIQHLQDFTELFRDSTCWLQVANIVFAHAVSTVYGKVLSEPNKCHMVVEYRELYDDSTT